MSGQAGRAATWDPQGCHVSPVAQPTSPELLAAWTAVEAYCQSLGKQGCLANAVDLPASCTMDARVDGCVQQVLGSYAAQVPSACQDAWRQDIACGATSVFAAPLCEGANLLGGTYGAAATCAAENAALSACVQKKDSIESHVEGSYADCAYWEEGGACTVFCQFGGNDAALTCQGAEGLPRQCSCSINGHVLTPSGGSPVFVNDCADAARQAADGHCTSRVDCCIQYVDEGNEVCDCFDPKSFGYDSCQAMADFGNGKIVNLCPQLMPIGGCWPPNSCTSTM